MAPQYLIPARRRVSAQNLADHLDAYLAAIPQLDDVLRTEARASNALPSSQAPALVIVR